VGLDEKKKGNLKVVMKLKIIIKIVLSCLILICLCNLTGCSGSLAGDWVYKETQRVNSPDGQVEAVIIEGDAGATTSKETMIVIVASGGKIDTKKLTQSDTVFRASHLKNFKVDWKQAKLLEVQYDEARIDQFRNLWEISEGRDISYPVEIRLAPTSPTFSVPVRDREEYPTGRK
jgi:hypothetical protein